MAVVNETGTFTKVIDLLDYHIWLVRREAIFVITNLITSAENNEEVLFHITSTDDFKVFKSLTKCLQASEKDNEVCEELLQAFDRILTFDKQYQIPLE